MSMYGLEVSLSEDVLSPNKELRYKAKGLSAATMEEALVLIY